MVDRYYSVEGIAKPWRTPEPGPTRELPPVSYTDRVKYEFNAMKGCVTSAYPGSWGVMVNVIMHDKPLPESERRNFQRGLDVLGRMWRMGGNAQ